MSSALPATLRMFFRMKLSATLVASFIVLSTSSSWSQSLQVTYGEKGLQTLSYRGVVLEDVGVNPADVFHIWHMKATGSTGVLSVDPQTGWGENNNGETWNSDAKTETYTFDWGSIAVQFSQQGDTLNLNVTETSNPGSGINFDGAEIYPFTLHFPADPVGFSGYSQFVITTLQPGVSAADFGSGIVTSVIPDETQPLYGGWKTIGTNTYSPILSTTSPDGLPIFLPHQDRPVNPGSSFSYTVSFRFTPEGSVAPVADAYSSFAQAYPSQMTWTDKRIIGTAYLASSPDALSGINQPGGFTTNPRRYFNDPSVDVTTAAGLQAFQQRMLTRATNEAATAQALSGQGVITWDIEGEQFPQSTSYVCSPDQIASVAPEMESIISDTGSPFAGRRLDDAYFSILSAGGLRTGVCLRPQVFTLAANGTASQIFLGTNAAIIANLENKARYANTRWGTTLFYVDSVVDANGGTLDPAIFQRLITDLPGFLFIPEESTVRYYAYSAPFYSFLFHTDLGTSAAVYNVYPNAFGANLVNDVSASTLAAYLPQLTQSVKNGDILMGHADYWQANDPTLISIYQAAGVSTAPAQTVPVVNWSAPGVISYGTSLSNSQLNASANTPGTFTYMPAMGTLLPAGTTTLLATFIPNDTKDYTTATASVPMTVIKATPLLTWPSSAPLSTFDPLGPAQLNATSVVPGTYTYTPAAGTYLPAGTITLNVVFQPNDASNYQAVKSTAQVTVSQGTAAVPFIQWSQPAAIRYGTALNGSELNAVASIPGSFSYNPAGGTVLAAGNHTLQVTFTPADLAHYRISQASVSLTVNRAIPVLTWQTPNPIFPAQRLTAVQLDPSSSVAGQFHFSPALGTPLPVGTHSLTAMFSPQDSGNYVTSKIQVTLTVLPAPKAVR